MRPNLALIIVLLLAALVAGFPATAAAAEAASVGFEALSLAQPDGPPMEVGVWYPADAPAAPQPLGGFSQSVALGAAVAGGGHPLVVMSHGTGGWFAGHYDTALALARAGFVVAALTHPGDNYRDDSRAADLPARPRQLHRLIDYMLADWPGRAAIDADRVGAFGFSAGGFTVLTAIGGVPDLSGFAAHCRARPELFDCGVARKAGLQADLGARFPASAWVHDGRIKAAVVAAPALGFTFAPDGLKGVGLPLQLWRAEFDHILPQPDYAEAVRRALPTPPDYHVVADADHFDFLAPCDPDLAKRVPEICVTRPGFDRAAFHRDFDAAVTAFFLRTLARPAQP